MVDEERRRRIARLEAAMAEFFDRGYVVDTACQACEQPIVVTALSDSAWSSRCPCGASNDTLRGI